MVIFEVVWNYIKLGIVGRFNIVFLLLSDFIVLKFIRFFIKIYGKWYDLIKFEKCYLGGLVVFGLVWGWDVIVMFESYYLFINWKILDVILMKYEIDVLDSKYL